MKRLSVLATIVCLGLAQAPARAQIVVSQDTSANSLAAALIAGNVGVTVDSATLDFHTSGAAVSSGTYALTGPNSYNLNAPGIVLSSGNVSDYSSGPNTTTSKTTSYGAVGTAAQTALLDPITGVHAHNDVTELTINFSVDATVSKIFFNVVFGSEEYPEYVHSSFIDGFGLFLNGTNIAFVGGQPVNIDHPDFAPIPGTELDGVLAPGGNPLLTFSGNVVTGMNTLTVIISDTSDFAYDSTVYLSSLGKNDVSVPEPSVLALSGIAGLAGLGYSWRRRCAAKPAV